jgi:uncharacterized protein (TIGR03083 family)
VLADTTANAPIPTCPGWTAIDLARHVVQVYAHKAAVIRAGEAVPAGEVQAANDGPYRQVLERHEAVVTDLADLLSDLDPDAPAWTWMEGAGESTVAAWARRMSHEALIHRVDAELTVGTDVGVVDHALAIDGVNEVLTWMAGDPDVVASDEACVSGSGTVLLDYGDGAWLLDIGGGRQVVTPAEAGTPADVRVGGSAWALDLLLWGRPSSASWPNSTLVDRLRQRVAQSTQ